MPKYGCHNLERGDIDQDPAHGNQPRWGGVLGAGATVPPCPAAFVAPVAPGGVVALALPEHVRQLQEDLRTLGFLLVGTPNGSFSKNTEWAVREFQIYAKMAQVARIKAGVPPVQQGPAHLVTQLGQDGDHSFYVNSLESVANDAVYGGPVSGVVNAGTRSAIEHWLDHNWRCPVVIEAWSMAAGARNAIFQSGGHDCVNIWLHDEVPSPNPRMFTRDFTNYYTLPATHPANDMHVLGEYATYNAWSGPRSMPRFNQTWAEGELLPENLVGVNLGGLSPTQRSTFKVVRATSEVECIGFFDCINAYDNAFVSVGPCHWTLGIVNGAAVSEGELCGYLSYLRHADPAAFQAAIEFFGMRVDENWLNAAGVADGLSLFSMPARKYSGWVALQQEGGGFVRLAQNEAEANWFKSWHWVYRFVMAGRTIDGYRKRMWHMARVRLRDVRTVPWGAGVANVGGAPPAGRPANIGDVFTSEKAAALVQRWHVRFPGDVVSGGHAGPRLHAALANAHIATAGLAWGGDPSTWTDAHETALIQGLRVEVTAVGKPGFTTSMNHVDHWPAWAAGPNPNHYTLNPAIGHLSEDRNSFDFDLSDLPPAP